MTQAIGLHVSPETYARAVKDCLEEFRRGNKDRALVHAMAAGVDAAKLGMGLHECPKEINERLDLCLQFRWGHGIASSTNDNAKQGMLL